MNDVKVVFLLMIKSSIYTDYNVVNYQFNTYYCGCIDGKKVAQQNKKIVTYPK